MPKSLPSRDMAGIPKDSHGNKFKGLQISIIMKFEHIHPHPQVDTQLSSILKEQDPKTDYAQS